MFSQVVHPEALPMLEVWICNQNGKALNGEMVDSLPKHLFRKGILCRNKCWHVGSRVPVLFMRINVERRLCTLHICCGGPQRKSIFPEERSDQEMQGFPRRTGNRE